MQEKILTKNFIFTFASMFCNAMVMYMLMGTVTEYAESMGTGIMLAGLISGIYVFGGLCSRLCAGAGMQKLGWKRLALFSTAFHFIACCCYFLINNVTLLILIRFVHGLGFGAAANTTMTIGMSILPKSRYGEAAGYFMLATTLAVAVGPFIGGIVYDGLGANGCFAAASLLSLLMMVFLIPVNIKGIDPGPRAGTDTRARAKGTASQGEALDDAKGTAPQSESLADAQSAPLHDGPKANPKGLNKLLEVKAFPVSVCIFLAGVGYASLLSFYRVYAEEVDLTKEFAYFFVFYGGFLLISRIFAGKLQDKYGDHIVCIPGIFAQTIGLIVMAWHPCMVTIILAALGCALGFGTLNAACNAIVCRNASPERRPFAITTFWICCDGGVGIGPTLLGAAVAMAGYTGMYYVAAIVTLAALPVYYFAAMRKKK